MEKTRPLVPQGLGDGGRRAHPMRNKMNCMDVTCFPFFRTSAGESGFSSNQSMQQDWLSTEHKPPKEH